MQQDSGRIDLVRHAGSVQGVPRSAKSHRDPAHNYIENRATNDDSNSWQVKVDHRFRDTDNTFFRLSQMWVHHLDPLLGTQEVQPSDYHAYNYGGGWDHVVRSNLMFDVRGGVLQKPYAVDQAQALAGTDALKQLGFADIALLGLPSGFSGELPALQNDIQGASWPWTTGFGGNPNLLGQPLQPISTLVGAFPTPVAEASPWAAASGAFADEPRYKDGYSNQWNVEIQRELGPAMMASVAYVGSRNGRLASTGYANAAPTPSPNGTPQAVIDAQRAMPFMPANVHYTESIGRSRYNALQAKFERRLSNGFQTLVSYTWSKSIDTTSGYFGVEDGAGSRSSVQNFFDPLSNQGPSGFDIPHFFSWFAVWEVPAGQGKRWLHAGPRSWILGNWSLNSIVQARSGQVFNVGIAGDIANLGGTGPAITNYERPNLIGHPIPAHQTATQWFDPAAFQIPSGAFGNFGRNQLRSQCVVNADLSLFKNVPFSAGHQLQIRVEIFNMFNIQRLGVPSGTTIGQAGAGQVTSIAGTPRQIQLGVRVVF